MEHSARPLRLAAGAALLACVLASCGSTAQLSYGPASAPDGLSGPAATDGSLPDGTTDGAGEPRSPGNDGSTPGSGSAGAAPVSGQSPTTVTSALPSASSAVSRSTPIKIGVITQPGLEAAAKAFGLDGVTTGDTKKQVDAVVTWLRAHGGLGGHPITVYEYAVDMGDGSSDAIQNNACTAMTQDYKVRFVVTVLANLQTLTTCLAKHGVGLLADNTNMGDKTIAKYGYMLGHPSELAPGRMMTLLVDDLVKRGWLTAGSKIGILADDGPDSRATVDGPLTAVLKRHGLKAKTTVYVNPTTGDGGSSQSSSAVLRFRADGVDRVIPVGYSPLYMMIAAESQGYRPAYAMVSAQGPGALLEGTAPGNQLKDAAGIGWQPYLDIGRGTKPGPVSARETLCFDLMNKAGQGASSAIIKGFQAQVCDLLFYLKDLTDLKPDIPGDILSSGRILLGKHYVSPATFRVDVTNRTAGVAAYRSLAYLDNCTCFQYVSPVLAAP